MSENLTVTRQSIGGNQVVAAAGEVDVATVPDLKRAVVAAIDAGCRRLVIDLSETSFIDSTGLSTLVVAHRRMTTLGGRLALVEDDGEVARTLSLTGLADVLTICATRESAFDAVDDG